MNISGVGQTPESFGSEHPDYLEMMKRHGPVTPGNPGSDGETIVAEQLPPENSPPKKRKTRETPGKILSNSPHQEEYRRMMKEGHSSRYLERYADFRHGEKIADGTFRAWKSRMIRRDPSWLNVTYLKKKDGTELIASGYEVDLDVMQVRQQLMHLQLQRITVIVAEELNAEKLDDDTWREFKTASDMLDKIKEDQVDFGIRPATAQVTQFTLQDLPTDIPKQHSNLGQALGVPDIPAPDLAAVARQLGQLIPINKNQKAG